MTDTSNPRRVQVNQNLKVKPEVMEGYCIEIYPVKFKPYKPDGQRQMKKLGRWQRMNEYAGWTNCAETPTEVWTDFPDLRALLSERDALAARVERLEEVSAWHEKQRQDALNRADTISAAEDHEVLRICKLYGFGAVMDSASRQWVKIDRSGAFFIGGSVGDTSARVALQENPHD